MKRSILIIFFFFFLGLHEELFAQNLKISKIGDLALILKQTKNNEVMLLERIAAKEFHKILNEYRKSKGLDTVQWNESFWLTCRNHGFYMNANDILTHSEVKDKQYYTGSNPGERLNFVQDKEKALSWNGENALYNYSDYGSNLKEKANNIAQSSFEQWKNSPGHNANMLSLTTRHHGTAFIIADGKVYGTSLFGYKNAEYWADFNKTQNNPTTTEQPKDVTSGTTQTLTNQPEKEQGATRINLSKAQKELEKTFLSRVFDKENNQSVIQDKQLLLVAKKQVEYMVANQLVESEQKLKNKSFYAKDLAKRLAKAEGKPFWFLANKTNAVEYITMVETEEPDYNEETMYSQLLEKLITENNINTNNIEKLGFVVKIKRSKNILKVYGVLIIYTK